MDSGYGINSTGFVKKTFNDLKDKLEGRLKSLDLFGEDIDFSAQDPLYQFSVPILEIGAELWELAEQTFYSASPKYAEGVPLKATGKYIGISGKQAAKSSGIVRLNGTTGTSITTNYQIGTDSGINFLTTESKLIASSGYIDINCEAVLEGSSGNVPANTITKIISPIIGLNSITNLTEFTGGQDEESDIDFRDRYQKSTASGAGSTTDAVKANVLKVTGVTDADVTDNDEDTTVNGIPAHSFETLVKGGDDTDIANAIYAKKPGGIKAYGTTVINIVDSQGITHAVGFTRPTNTQIWVKVDVTTDSTYPSDGNTQVQNAVLNYVNGLGLGESVIIYKIITTISNLKLSGLTDMQITVSTDGITYTASNINIGSKATANTDLSKIGVI